MKVASALVAGLWLVLAAAGCDGDSDAPEQRSDTSAAKTDKIDDQSAQPRQRDRSVWTRPVPDDSPLDPRSDRLVASLNETVERGKAMQRPPWISIGRCSGRIITVPADQPTVRVQLTDAELPYKRSLQAAFERVPLPADAQPSDCPDRVIVLLQPSRDRMWDFWHLRREASGWGADWGGATRRLSKNPGSYGPSDWPGGQYNWGASGSSMTLLGAIRLAEARGGSIDHALTLSLPQAAAGVWAWPAQRTDGTLKGPDAIPYGAQFRLDPKLDVDSLNAPKGTKMIARAAQRYGLIVREQTNFAVALSAEAPLADGPNPWPELLGGQPHEVLDAFPWDRLELLKMDLRSKPGPPKSP